MSVGFIGLGLMGIRMANNLLEKGNELVVYNRTVEKAQPLIEKGAEFVETPADVGSKAGVIFTMLSEPDAVSKVAFGENGFLYQMEQKSIWVDCSTVNPSFTKDAAEKANGMNVRFIDAPVAGTILPAEKGELIFFAGGSKKDVDEVRPLLEAMGKKIIYMGENGKGTGIKMVINLLLGQAMIAFSEAVTLGEALGFSKEDLFNVLIEGPVTAPFLAGKKDKLAKGNYETEFPLQWMYKDLHLAALTGYENNISLQMTNTSKEIFSLANQYGLGEKDFSVVYEFLSNHKKNGKNTGRL